jgi:hypothetical protein
MNARLLIVLFALALPPIAPAADSQWILDQSTLTYHVSHPLHQTEGVSHAARGKGICHDGNTGGNNVAPAVSAALHLGLSPEPSAILTGSRTTDVR